MCWDTWVRTLLHRYDCRFQEKHSRYCTGYYKMNHITYGDKLLCTKERSGWAGKQQSNCQRCR